MSLISRVALRIFAVIAAIAVPSYVITYGGALMASQNVLDLFAFAFAACLTILNRNRILNFFVTPRIGTAHVFSLGLFLWSIGVCLSAMSAVHWRASGHLASLNDGGIRVVFRMLYDAGFACMLAASGTYEIDLSAARIRNVFVIALGVLAFVGMMLFGDVARGFLWPADPIPDWQVLERAR